MDLVLPPDPAAAPVVAMPPYPPAPPWPPGPAWRQGRTEGTKLPYWYADVDDPARLLDLWYACRLAYPQTGWWPLLIGEGFWESVEFEVATRPAPPPSGAAWLQQRLTGDEKLVDQIGRGERPSDGDPAAEPERDLLLGFAGVCEGVALFPTPAGWLLAEALNWEGAVNHDFSGAEHTLVMRRWAGYFGSELVGQTRDQVVLRVERPPSGPAAELAAYEATAYCEDLVFQGAGSLDGLIPMIESHVWQFWWD